MNKVEYNIRSKPTTTHNILHNRSCHTKKHRMLAIFYKDEKIVEENTHAKQDAHLKQNITSLLK